jgi:hypothetical protein
VSRTQPAPAHRMRILCAFRLHRSGVQVDGDYRGRRSVVGGEREYLLWSSRLSREATCVRGTGDVRRGMLSRGWRCRCGRCACGQRRTSCLLCGWHRGAGGCEECHTHRFDYGVRLRGRCRRGQWRDFESGEAKVVGTPSWVAI